MTNHYKEDIDTNSLFVIADSLVSKTQEILIHAKTEEDLKIGFEKLIEPIKKQLGIISSTPPQYEKTVYSGRSDAVHGQVIIEYEPPRSFSSERNVNHAYRQLVNYLSCEVKKTSSTSF